MNRVEREKMVRAMEFIARQVNDEELLESWLTVGVADGDIPYGKLELSEDFDEYYVVFETDGMPLIIKDKEHGAVEIFNTCERREC